MFEVFSQEVCNQAETPCRSLSFENTDALVRFEILHEMLLLADRDLTKANAFLQFASSFKTFRNI